MIESFFLIFIMSGIIAVKGQFLIPISLLKPQHKKKLNNIIPYSDSKVFKKKKFSIYKEIKHNNITYAILPRNFGIKEYGIKHSACSAGEIVKFPEIYKGITPKDYQKEAVQKIYSDYLSGSYGSLLNMSPGAGKTFTSILIMCCIAKKTLIVTDKNRSDQWSEEILRFLPDLKKEEIGVLQDSKDGSVLKDSNKKIVISVINTISNGKFDTSMYTDFGFVIMDEVDSYISEKYIRVFDYTTRRYIMGMTGTLTRPDKLGYLIEWYIGPIVFKYMKSYKGKLPIVRKIVYNSDNQQVYRKDGSVDPTNTYLTVMNDENREKILIELINEYVKIEAKTKDKILVIGLYRAQLERLYKKLNMLYKSPMVGIYYGAKSKKDKIKLSEVVKNCKIILAIRSMGYKGLNVPDARIMIMASSYIPKNKGENTESLDQLVGRILRKDHNNTPVIVDIVDNFGFFKNHGRLRQKYYIEKGYKIVKEIIK